MIVIVYLLIKNSLLSIFFFGQVIRRNTLSHFRCGILLTHAKFVPL